jgi:hypothetical protein
MIGLIIKKLKLELQTRFATTDPLYTKAKDEFIKKNS